MNKTSTFKQTFPWGLMTFFAVGVAIAAIAPYATFNPDNFNNATARYATESVFRQVWLYIHIFASGIALVLGPFQFLSGLRTRRPSIHPWMGRIYLTGVLPGALSAFIIAPGVIFGMVGAIRLLCLASLCLWTGWMACRD